MTTTNSGLQSIADLTASTRLTTGDIPPPLVGSSTTVVGTCLYIFAGRLVSTRKMTNDIYLLDLETFVWTKIPDNNQVTPKERYFHSANQYENSIVIFGGMGYKGTSSSNDDLCVLDDLCVFNLETHTWNYPEIVPSNLLPRPRYAHLASVTANKLVIIGGQDLTNYYIEEINVLDLVEMKWISTRPFKKHCGAYSDQTTEAGPSAPKKSISSQTMPPNSPANVIRKPPSTGSFSQSGSLRRPPSSGHVRSRSAKRIQSSGNSFYHRLSYSSKVTEDNPTPVYLYSNYNFADVKRELQLITPPTIPNYQIVDHSTNMSGALPPGLRFPTGAILGQHLIISGTYLTSPCQTFSIWALNLANFIWIRIDTGSCFLQGSWNRGVLCEATNKYYVLGHRDRSLVDDYNHRQTNYNHVTVVDLEAFGIYRPPPTTMTTSAQELGLALLNDPNIADFEIITQDEQRIPVNSQILSQRWPHFKALVEMQADRAPRLKYDEESQKKIDDDLPILMYHNRALEFPEPSSVTLAFLQYLYTDHLLTSQQNQPHVLSQLLLLADMYDLDRLRQLASHALHVSLSMTTAALIYETAALSRQTGLQIRALKVMIAAKKMLQQSRGQILPQGLQNNGQSGYRSSVIDHDLSPTANWATSSNPASPPISAMSSEMRTSYYDPYAVNNNNLHSPPIHSTRSRSLSAASAHSATIPNRGYLPTIQDTMPSNDVTPSEGISTPPQHPRLRTSASTSSLNSSRSARTFGTTGFGNGNAQPHQQDPNYGYVGGDDACFHKFGWLRVTKEFEMNSTTNGPTFGNMMKQGIQSFMEGKNSQLKRSKDSYFAVLKYNTLFMYDSERQLDCKGIIIISNHNVSIYPENLPDNEIFSKATSIRLKTKQSVYDDMKIDIDDTTYYLFCNVAVEKEDWYFVLQKSSKLESNSPGPQPQVVRDKAQFDQFSMNHLLKTLYSNDEHIETQWLNAILGRVFLSVYKTQAVKDHFVRKLIRKVKKIKKPSFLSDIQIKSVEVGDGVPYLTNPRLAKLDINGGLSVDVDLDYNGGFRVEIETEAIIAVTKLKTIKLPVVLAVVLRGLQGRLLLRIKPPPTNRIWTGFYEMPKLDLLIEPVVSETQLKFAPIIKVIESKIHEMFMDSLVLPNMDDAPFFRSFGMGGIFEGDVKIGEENDENENEEPNEQNEDDDNNNNSIDPDPDPELQTEMLNTVISETVDPELQKTEPELLLSSPLKANEENMLTLDEPYREPNLTKGRIRYNVAKQLKRFDGFAHITSKDNSNNSSILSSLPNSLSSNSTGSTFKRWSRSVSIRRQKSGHEIPGTLSNDNRNNSQQKKSSDISSSPPSPQISLSQLPPLPPDTDDDITGPSKESSANSIESIILTDESVSMSTTPPPSPPKSPPKSPKSLEVDDYRIINDQIDLSSGINSPIEELNQLFG
nr:5748_t:CDS:2 [Entrophospora candida]